MNDAHPSSAEVGVVVVAAGLGTRLGAGMPKALVPLAGQPLVVHAARAARGVRGLRQLVVVAPAPDLEQFRALVPDAVVVAGGAERTDSVAAGLGALGPGIDVVLVHDAARALAPTALFDRVVNAVREGYDAVVPGLAVHDTVKQVDDAGLVTATPDRDGLRAVQTPQGFTRDALQRAHSGGSAATDDAAMVERSGGRVLVIEGDPLAEKITTAADLQNAASRLRPPDGATLIVLGGLPGVGKTTTARALAARKALTHLRVDVIEQAVVDSGLEQHPVGEVGYRVSYELAAHHLHLGMTVVADMVNGVPYARDAWRDLAAGRGVRLLEVELFCSDQDEHRRRASTRVGDIEGMPQPSWEQIQEREYHPWQPDLRIDTAAHSPGRIADTILAALAAPSSGERITR
ncbi:2-C-methyl-D-erythritol 4-phosphate cytidylyltransferase [Allobranchiibius sp. GilTou73]|uniref:2-C-methyl-D-erythritol 4-phosphate cytidylyltransferase n=1 Tax=Allobranchiibius sp. GilTou73 TaxID=2904523 RepID=UPI00351CF80F